MVGIYPPAKCRMKNSGCHGPWEDHGYQKISGGPWTHVPPDGSDDVTTNDTKIKKMATSLRFIKIKKMATSLMHKK